MCPLLLDATSSVYLYLIRFKSVSSNDDDYEDDNMSTESLPFGYVTTFFGSNTSHLDTYIHRVMRLR